MKIYAMITEQSTAAMETALCEKHYNESNRTAREVAASKVTLVEQALPGWHDCSGNAVLECQVCGSKSSYVESYLRF